MKIINFINQNIPFWSVLKGDHACHEKNTCLHESLIQTPNFLDPRENALRKTFLKETKGRKWLHDYLDGRSFAVATLEKSDIENVLTVWKDVPLIEVATEYKKAYNDQTGFKYKKIKKPAEAVLDVKRRKITLPEVDETDSWLTSFDEDLDYHRGIWMKRKSDNKFQIIDGTHRTLATTWKYLLDKQKMPKQNWFAIVFHE